MKNINLNADKVSINNTSLETYLNNNNATISNNANLDLSNLSDKGRKTFLPSETYITLSQTATSYTPPANGILLASRFASVSGEWQEITMKQGEAFIVRSINPTGNTNGGIYCWMPVVKNKEVNITYDKCNHNSGVTRFIYAEGEV